MWCLRVTLASAGLGLCLASPASGQAAGLVVRNAGVSQGVTLGAVYGRGRDRSSSGASGLDAVGARAQIGLGPIGVSLGIARTWLEPAGLAKVHRDELSATAALTVFGGPLVPLKVAWQVGGSRSLGTDQAWRGSHGLGAALVIPAALLSIRPWLAPRIDYLGHQTIQGSRVKPAFAAGIEFGLLTGLGVQIEYDSRLGWDAGSGRVPGIGIGVSHHFR